MENEPRRRREVSAPAERLPPWSQPAEIGTLGCILLDPGPSLSICTEKIQRGVEVFFDLRHQSLYETLVGMFDKQEHIDLLTIKQKLSNSKTLDALGGVEYLVGLQNATPSAASITYYLDIVIEKWRLRRIIQVCTSAVARVYDHQGEVNELVDQVGRDVLAACETERQTGPKKIKDLVHIAIDQIESLHRNEGKPMGLSTGFSELDKMTSGFQSKDLIIIAARPSIGKTSLAMNFVEHIAVTSKEPVGMFSLEMSAESLTLRMICSRGRVNLRNVNAGFLAERDFPKLSGAATDISNAPIHIDDSIGLNIMQIRAGARMMRQTYGIRILLIDHFSKISSIGHVENRQQAAAQISNGVKMLAQELDIPVVLLVQLNRDLDKEKKRKPRLSDIRETGALEQDGDLVCMLYKPEKENDDEEEGDSIPVNLLIAKQRNGPTGDVHLTFLKGITKFESASKVSDMPNYDV